MTVAYSYLRFSSPQQATGDSIRRQVEKTEDWCRRHKVELDTSIRLRDEGVSAFKGKHRENPDTHALAGFLTAVKSGRVQAGSYLVVESLDRLSREKIRPALTLLLNLIEAGVRVVQLLPVEAVYDEDVEPMALLQAIMELNRGHSESKVKSERVGAAWARKRREAATRVVTRRLPGWVKYEDGRLVLDKPAARTVKQIYQMARDGQGVHAIAEALNREGLSVLGRKVFKGQPVAWSETTVYHLLTTRTVEGVWCLFAGRGAVRVAAVEVWFTNGKRRCYLLGHEQPRPQAIPPRGRQTWSVVMDGLWTQDTGTDNSLRDPEKVRQVAKNLNTFTVPEYEALVDATGNATVRAALATNPAALLASLEYMDPDQLPGYAVARIRAVAGSAVQLGWPVFEAQPKGRGKGKKA
jgi:DNA invertase Pin-like site-specific DNA recombinase